MEPTEAAKIIDARVRARAYELADIGSPHAIRILMEEFFITVSDAYDSLEAAKSQLAK